MAIPFVVRADGQWWLTPVSGTGPVPASMEEILAALDGAPDALLPADRHSNAALDRALADDTVVAPIWAWVGAVTATGVVVEDVDGERRCLNEDDLRVLDALAAPVSVAVLAQRSGVVDAAHRLAPLVRAGRVRIDPDQAAAPTVPPGESSPRRRPAPPLTPPPTRSAPDPVDRRVPVHSIWLEWVGPPLSLGMLTASARAWSDGVLNESFDLRRPEESESFLAAVGAGSGPAVLLCSNYVWSVDDNLRIARAAKAVRPDLVVVHGGPSTPKYPGDAERFLNAHGDVADVLVRGEGEVTVCHLLEAMAPTLPALDTARLAAVDGLTFRDPVTGEIVRTGEPERVTDLDSLPSPYLTGEFDHIAPEAWRFAVSVETNRGCPYGCTFCDWGSAILSRIRKFSAERVLGEFEWAAERGVGGIQICDANFGIMARDVELAEGLADVRRRTGHPMGVGFTPPKNTTRHVTRILDAVMGAGLHVSTAISLQSTDGATLDAVDRANISTDNYLALAADLRRRGHPLMGDLLLGLPAQTYTSYKADLQFFVDHQIMARTWIAKMLPNSPMNAPEYRARHQIEVDDRGIVAATATLGRIDVERAHTLRRAEIIANRLGVLRHIGRFLHWDHGVALTDLLDHVIEVTDATPERFPLLSWVMGYFDLHATAPVGWTAFYGEVTQLLVADFGVDPDGSDLETVRRVQVALMPVPGRRFPHPVALDHDYVAYHRDATSPLFLTGAAGRPPRPLAAYPPGSFEVTGDPLQLCDVGLHFDGDSRDPVFEGDFAIGQRTANELVSPLLELLPVFSGGAPALEAVRRAALVEIPEPSHAVLRPAGDPHEVRPASIQVEVR